MAAYYPLFEDDMKQGPPGIPGIGFKLTNDGNYDMEKKALTNIGHPIQLNDSVSKHYADVMQEGLKAQLVALSEASLIQNLNGYFDARNKRIVKVSDPEEQFDCATRNYVDSLASALEDRSLVHSDRGGFDAKNKTIGNVKDPESEKNAVNRRYFENNALVVQEGVYDGRNRRIVNLADPDTEQDGVNKQYVDSRTKLNGKQDNLLSRDDDGLYVPSLIKHGAYDFGNKRLTNVSEPRIPIDVATKRYVDSQDFFATFKGGEYFTCSPGEFKEVKFNSMSSQLLDQNLSLSANMHIQISLHVLPLPNPIFKPLSIRVELNGDSLLLADMNVQRQTNITSFWRCRKGDIMKVFISCEKDLKLKPYLHIKRIEFIWQYGDYDKYSVL